MLGRGPQSHLFSRQNMPFSFSLFPQVWCSSPQAVLKRSAEICWFVDVFLVFVGGVWCSGGGLSSVQGNRPFSLLAMVLLTQPSKLLACAASAHCWLLLSSVHTKSFHWPASQQSPAYIVYSLPSAGQGFCSCRISGGSYFCLKTGARFAFCLLGACLSPFKGAPCK